MKPIWGDDKLVLTEMDAAGGLKLDIANLWVAVTDFQELGTVVKRGRSMDF